MKTELIVIGKTVDKNFIAGIKEYSERISHYMPFFITTIPALRNTKSISEQQQKDMEGELFLKMLQSTDTIILLDEHGKDFKSLEFASWLQKKQQACRKLVFIIGGPYGFSDAMHKRADGEISLSKMTFSHQMIRLIFVEQLYRACTILKGESYHHE